MLPRLSTIHNLNISREAAVTIAIVGTVVSLAAIVIGVLAFGVDEKSTPIIIGIPGMFGLLVNGLVSALKATESADTSSKNKHAVEFTVSQNAALLQLMGAHCGDICPLAACPLRSTA